jgi:hypothetical protein
MGGGGRLYFVERIEPHSPASRRSPPRLRREWSLGHSGADESLVVPRLLWPSVGTVLRPGRASPGRDVQVVRFLALLY